MITPADREEVALKAMGAKDMETTRIKATVVMDMGLRQLQVTKAIDRITTSMEGTSRLSHRGVIHHTGTKTNTANPSHRSSRCRHNHPITRGTHTTEEAPRSK